jgi:hypothetical protein
MSPKRAVVVAAGFVLSLVLAGCSGAEEPAVATAASRPAVASGSPGGAVAAYVEAQRSWVRCLRGAGFDLPDPDDQGRIDFSGQDNRKLKADPKWLAAQQNCREFSREVPDELVPDRKLSPEQLARSREYSKCMRENGMPSFPDPLADGGLPEGWGNELTPQEEAANISAIQICSPVQDGRPKGTPNPNDVPLG